ncbi:Altered inheritance of mitochondria protein 19-like protein [Frankliniella fusca]|uniref:Altered inheritance of mitochondria protein 19-like protein n=1 Tax=Frankliniella fusca TaxID=407009 RepID=A0AAE1HRN1_9NEOP|nr:Altered inheritance of mitochondria protein 19-like protein [Frankliniella fusca]
MYGQNAAMNEKRELMLSYFQNIADGLVLNTAIGLAMIGSLPLQRSYFCLIAFAPVIAKRGFIATKGKV